MTYDSVRGRVVLFGGGNTYGPLADTWEWDGADWTQRTPTTAPEARMDCGIAFDPVRGVTVVFGGYGIGGGQLGDTWTWDGTSWTHLLPATSPGAREGREEGGA